MPDTFRDGNVELEVEVADNLVLGGRRGKNFAIQRTATARQRNNDDDAQQVLAGIGAGQNYFAATIQHDSADGRVLVDGGGSFIDSGVGFAEFMGRNSNGKKLIPRELRGIFLQDFVSERRAPD